MRRRKAERSPKHQGSGPILPARVAEAVPGGEAAAAAAEVVDAIALVQVEGVEVEDEGNKKLDRTMTTTPIACINTVETQAAAAVGGEEISATPWKAGVGGGEGAGVGGVGVGVAAKAEAEAVEEAGPEERDTSCRPAVRLLLRLPLRKLGRNLEETEEEQRLLRRSKDWSGMDKPLLVGGISRSLEVRTAWVGASRRVP